MVYDTIIFSNSNIRINRDVLSPDLIPDFNYTRNHIF